MHVTHEKGAESAQRTQKRLRLGFALFALKSKASLNGIDQQKIRQDLILDIPTSPSPSLHRPPGHEQPWRPVLILCLSRTSTKRRRRRLTSLVSATVLGGRLLALLPLMANTALSPTLDLKAQYEVKLEEGLDTFVVIDGLPVVPEESRQKLIKFLLRKLNTVGHTSEDAVFMPLNDKNMSEGYVKVEEHGVPVRVIDLLLLTDMHSSSSRPPNKLSPQSSSCTALPLTKSTPFS